MPYRYISYVSGGTLQEIASSNNVTFNKGGAYYEVTKKEKISLNKSLLLYTAETYPCLVSCNSTEIRRLCGIEGKVDVAATDIPENYMLFVQSTSHNRKIPEGNAVVFTVDDDEADSGDEEDPVVKKARVLVIDYNQLLKLPKELDDNYFVEFFTQSVGTRITRMDEAIPDEVQHADLLKICALAHATWSECNGRYDVSILGTALSDDLPTDARIEYRVYHNATLVAMSLGTWGCMLGAYESHPFIYSTNIFYNNTDGSFDMPQMRCPASATKEQIVDMTIGYALRLYQLIASNAAH